MYFQENEAFNRYINLDGVEWRVINALINSNSKYAQNLWKLLKYPTEDCLFQPDLTLEEKMQLIYVDNGLSNDKRVFMAPFVDDAWTEQASRLDVFTYSIFPQNHISSQIGVGLEIVVHNKINNILGEASLDSPVSNPSEITSSGELLVPYKSRSTTMLKSVLAELNGSFINGVGYLQHNAKGYSESTTKSKVWNNRAYLGFQTVMYTLMSGASDNCSFGKGY